MKKLLLGFTFLALNTVVYADCINIYEDAAARNKSLSSADSKVEYPTKIAEIINSTLNYFPDKIEKKHQVKRSLVQEIIVLEMKGLSTEGSRSFLYSELATNKSISINQFNQTLDEMNSESYCSSDFELTNLIDKYRGGDRGSYKKLLAKADATGVNLSFHLESLKLKDLHTSKLRILPIEELKKLVKSLSEK
jgi:hypothetical protein